MAAPRATQFIALRNLSRTTSQVRKLHMTGPATYASPVLTSERPMLNLPRDIAGLRAECKKRKIDAGGSEQDLISRLQADHLTHSRAFTTASAQSKRPSPSPSSPAPVRHFNTSLALKAVGDSSTIDFAYLPSGDQDPHPPETLRVPILPDLYNTNPATSPFLSDDIPPVMKPEISTMSADAVFLPMSDLTDGHAMNVDFHAMADRVALSLRKMNVGGGAASTEEQASIMKQLWGDIVDDVMKAVGSGAKKASS